MYKIVEMCQKARRIFFIVNVPLSSNDFDSEAPTKKIKGHSG